MRCCLFTVINVNDSFVLGKSNKLLQHGINVFKLIYDINIDRCCI